MSNLGRYQDFATDAKQFGGVESYLRMIEANAVAGATLRLYARAIAATLAVAGGLAAVGFEARRRRDARQALNAEAAREHLIAAAQECDESARAELNLGGPASESESRTCSWCGKPGHDQHSCGVPHAAAGCSVCGFHGHISGNCSRGKE